MNGPFQVAQANIAGQTAGKPPVRVVKIAKPFSEQSVVVPLSYDGSVKADLSAIAGEKITLVHIGEKLIILFDNKSTITLEPFFDSTGKPLDSITVEVAPGRDLTGTEFATLFPVTEDQSVLPAAGEGGNAQASGANFTSVGVDPLALSGPLELLGQEELPNFVITNLLTPTLTNDTPTVGQDALALDEDEISGAGGNPGGINDIVSPASFTGVLTHNFGADGPGDINFAAMNGTSRVINGITVTFSWDQATHTLLANDGTDDVFKIVVSNPATGAYEATVLHALHHHTDALADNTETSNTFDLIFTVVDGNGTPADGHLLLEINDDTPNAFDTLTGSFDGDEFFPRNIDDENQFNGVDGGPGDDGDSTSVSGVLNVAPGADGLKAVAFTGLDGLPHLTVIADDGSNPVLQAIYVDGSGIGTPEDVTLAWTPDGSGGGTLTGTSSHFDGINGHDPVFTLTVDAAGNYTYTAFAPLAHPLNTDGVQGSTATAWEDNLNLAFTYTVTDGDGDRTSALLTINVDDDVPVAANDAGYGPYNENASGVDLGLASVLLANDKYGADGAAAADSLTIAVGDHGGTVTIDLSGHLIYTNTSNVANGVTDVETFTYTIKDGDNDTDTATFTVSRTDSGVTMGAAPANLLADEDNIPVIGANDTQTGDDDQTLTGTISYTLGADHIGSVALSTAGNATGLFKLDGTAIQTSWDAGTRTLTGYGTSVSDVVFTIVLGVPTDTGAGYTLTLLQPVKHADGLNENDTPAFTVNAVVTDSDGSTGNTSFTVVIDDDVPVLDIVNMPNSVNENQTIDGTWTLTAGADGVTSVDVTVGAVTKTLSLAVGSNTVTFGAGDGLTAGTLTVDADLQWHFVANSVTSNENVTFTLKATDGDGDNSSDSQTLTIVNVNQPLAITGSIVGLVEEEHGVPGGIDDISSASLAPNNDQDTAGNLNVTTNVFVGTFSPPLSFTGDEGTLSYSVNSVIEGSAVTKAGGGALTSDGAAVLFHVSGDTLTGYVEVSGAGFSGADRIVFTLELNQPADGQYRFTLLDNLDHHTVPAADNVENIIGINFNNLVKVTDNGDLNDDEPIANFTINVIDDVPVAAIADYAVMSNGAGSPVIFGLDFDNTLANNYGADAAGTVRFPASLDGALSGLTSNGVSITYTVSGDGLTLTAMAGLASVFVVTLNPAAATYSVDMNAVVDSISTVNFSDGSYQFDGGNTAWVALVPAGQKDNDTPVDDDSRDILITPIGTADTVNNNANSTGAGGGSGGQNIGDGEGVRLDFVIDLTGDTGGAGGYGDTSNRDYVFDDHYNTNGATIKFGDGSTNTTLQITARDETVATDANNIVGDGILDSVNKIIINYDGESEVITFAAIGTTATDFTVGNPGGLGDRTYNVQFVDVDPGAGVKYAAKIIGVLDTNVTIATYTADGYHSLELLNQAGDDFAITGFGAAVQTTAPVSLDVPILVVDGDGDTAASTLGITLVQPGSGIQNHSSDLIGDSHTYTSTVTNPHIIGSDFADTLNGDGAANVLSGGLGIDSLFGNGGNDILIGGPGADNLTGGLGADIFRLTDTAAADIIGDFNNAEGDKIDLTALFSVASGHSLSEYVVHTGTTLQVDVDGNLNGTNFVTVATSLPNTPSAITIMYEDAAHAVQSAVV